MIYYISIGDSESKVRKKLRKRKNRIKPNTDWQPVIHEALSPSEPLVII